MIDRALARSIRLVVLDLDGVLTDGGIYLGAVDDRPLEFKRYDIQDGLGIHLMQRGKARILYSFGCLKRNTKICPLDPETSWRLIGIGGRKKLHGRLGGITNAILDINMRPKDMRCNIKAFYRGYLTLGVT